MNAHLRQPRSSPCLSRLTFRPFRLQPPPRHFVTVALTRYFTAVTGRVYPPGRPRGPVGMPSRGPGFGHSQEPPRQAWPNRVHLRCGLAVRLRLLSTFPHGNAVTTFDYGPVTLAREGLPPSQSNAFTGALGRFRRNRHERAQHAIGHLFKSLPCAARSDCRFRRNRPSAPVKAFDWEGGSPSQANVAGL